RVRGHSEPWAAGVYVGRWPQRGRGPGPATTGAPDVSPPSSARALPAFHSDQERFQSPQPLPLTGIGSPSLRTSTGSPTCVCRHSHPEFSVLRPTHPWLTLRRPCAHVDHHAVCRNSPLQVTLIAYRDSRS